MIRHGGGAGRRPPLHPHPRQPSAPPRVRQLTSMHVSVIGDELQA